MPIVVNNPIVVKPRRPKHTSSTPRAHAPAVKHVRAPKATHTAAVTHARRSSSKSNLTAVEVSTGSQDNANELAALNGGYFGTAAQVSSSNAAGKTWTGPFDQYGLPTGKGSGRQGLRVVDNSYSSFQAYMKAIQPQINKYRAENNAVLAANGLGGAAGSSSGKTTATPHVPAVHTPKVTAPLQLSDSGLLGHDSHVARPPALANIAPVTTRHPGH